METQNLKIGTHRARSRVWLDHKETLEAHGFAAGNRFDVLHEDGVITIWPNLNGARKVSANKDRPIIDLCSVAVTKALAGFSRVNVEYSKTDKGLTLITIEGVK